MMRHHRYNQGWREANEMSPRSFAREIISLACVYGAVIAFIVIVVAKLAR